MKENYYSFIETQLCNKIARKLNEYKRDTRITMTLRHSNDRKVHACTKEFFKKEGMNYIYINLKNGLTFEDSSLYYNHLSKRIIYRTYKVVGSNPTPPRNKSVDNSIGFFLYRHRDHGVE